MTWPHAACWSAPQRDATERRLYSLELFTSSPGLGLLDEHQEIGFKYNREKCAQAGDSPSRKLWLLQNLATKAPTAALSDRAPAPITASCCQTSWSLLHRPPSLPQTFPPLNCSPGMHLASYVDTPFPVPPSTAQLGIHSAFP